MLIKGQATFLELLRISTRTDRDHEAERIAGVARELGREPVSPEDARGILGLGKKPSAKCEPLTFQH